jgi:hypothetical protein
VSGRDPRAEYQRRVAACEAAIVRDDALDLRLSNLRGLVMLAAATLFALWWTEVVATSWWGAAPLVVFLALVVAHERVYRRRARARLAAEHYRRGLRRIDDQWRDEGVQHRDFVAAEHPYAADLDLFGRGSLFALLCTARTRGGEETLAGWLLRPASAAEIRARQAAVAALRGRVDLREELALLGGDVRVTVQPEALTAWGEAPPWIEPRRRAPLRLLASSLALAAVAAATAAAFTEVGLLPLVAVGVVEGVVMGMLRRTTGILAAVEGPRRDLDVLARVLARVEREPTGEDPRLTALLQRLRGGGAPASAAIARLTRTVDWLDIRKSVLAPITFFLMWELHGAVALERWRALHGAEIARWLAALGELEALNALANYAYERPEQPMPTIVDAGPRVRGDDLRHPLLPGCVTNSIDLGDPLRVLMISGSNMSGKSTLLRTLGVNVVLALAGAPVAARAMTLSPLQIGATLRIEDSLHGASSRFYSELRRLRLLRDLARAGDPPLLFLLDEIFHGTNSHDRKIGAEVVLRALVDAGAVGLCTTHDLALAEAIAELGARAENVHFQDELVGDRLVFDYRMRPGIVRRSNAIALMRSVGLLAPPTD